MLKRIACFVLLLPAMVLAQPLDRVVAVVNDGVITASELEAQVQLLREQIRVRKMPFPSETVLRKQVLQHLIDIDLELQLAKQNDIVVDAVELIDAIAKIAENNKLSLSQLQDEVSHQGLSWQAYRDSIRKEMIIARLQQKAVGKEVINVSTQQVEDYLKTSSLEDKTQLTYHIQNIVIPLPDDSTVEQLKKAHQKANELLVRLKKGDNFSRLAIEQSNAEFALEESDLGKRHIAELPDIFAKEVVRMKVGQVAGPLRAGNGLQLIKLIAIDGNNEKHEVIKTHVRHILLKENTNATLSEVSKQADNLYQQLKSGKDFAMMAKQYSLDVVSAAKGGDLGWVSPGDVVLEFEKTMMSLPLHQVSKPLKTSYGWHIIEVLERKKVDDSAAFKRQQARLVLQQKKFAEAVQNWQQHLRTNAYIKVMDKDLA